MAWTPADEKLYNGTLAVMNAAQLKREIQNLRDRLMSQSGPEISEQIINKLRLSCQEHDMRGLGNALSTATPAAPPPIPGVNVISAPKRAPAPPVVPKQAGKVAAAGTMTYQSGTGPVTVPALGGTINTVPTAGPDPTPIEFAAMPNQNRNCARCPAFVSHSKKDEQIELFGVATGLAMCARLHIPLETLTQTTEEAHKMRGEIAQNCVEWGRPKSPVNLTHPTRKYRIAVDRLDGEVKKIAEDMQTAKDGSLQAVPRARACSSCVFYAKPEQMTEQLGIPQAACTAHGKLIPVGKGKATADSCGDGIEDFQNTEAYNYDWTKQLLNPYSSNITVIGMDMKPGELKPVHSDPLTYPTDKELTEEDRAEGIRAWQKLMDPEKGSDRFVYMPIFDPEFFAPEERVKIPVAGVGPEDSHPELYEDHFGLLYTCMVLWTQLHETPALNGIAGTGKTAFFEYAAYRMSLPFERFSITNSTELDELQGRMNLVSTETGNVTEFVYGRVALAWQKPCILCIDEPNTGPNDVWQFFRPLTDNVTQMVIDVNNGERLARHKHVFMGMAFNPSWDMRNVGTHEIGDADGSRLMHVEVPMPTPEQERKIIQRRCALDDFSIPKTDLDAVMAIAKELRDLAGQDAFPVHWGIRNQIKVARALAWFPFKRAYRLAAGDLLEPAYRDQLLTIVGSHLPGSKAESPTTAKRKPGRSKRNTL